MGIERLLVAGDVARFIQAPVTGMLPDGWRQNKSSLFHHFTTKDPVELSPPPTHPSWRSLTFSWETDGNRISNRKWEWVCFLLNSCLVTLQIFQQFLKRKRESRKGGVASRCMALCWVSVHGGRRRRPCQALGDVSTQICGSTSLWGLWVPRWGFCSGSPARPRGSPDTWRTPSSSCDTRGPPPCATQTPCQCVNIKHFTDGAADRLIKKTFNRLTMETIISCRPNN